GDAVPSPSSAVDFVLTSLIEHFRALLSSTISKSTAKRTAELQTKCPARISRPGLSGLHGMDRSIILRTCKKKPHGIQPD
ncbi:MAG: hypothetical protein Q8Q59_15750, partial [Luteolibacter sp.]|nr:hypothetical protein [Luteolibacter sp.]